MKGEFPPDDVPRIVKPRTSNFTHRHIITVTTETTVVERTGIVFSTSDLPRLLITEPSSIIVAQGFGPILELLTAKLKYREDYNYRVTPQHREGQRYGNGDAVPIIRVYDAITNYVGFRGPNKKAGKYHYPIDPVHFCRSSIDELYPAVDEGRMQKLFRWASEVREWCREHDLEIKTAAGGLAAQLLKDPRFYPEARRKSPRLINNVARPHLPGNYYRLHADTEWKYNAIYLDMENAHHSMARNIAFPCVNDLHFYGAPGAAPEPRPYAPGDSDLLTLPGLFRVSLSVPHVPLARFPPPYMEQGGLCDAWVYSNELPMIQELGGRVLAVYSAVVSHQADPGLNRYARFAIEQIREHQAYKPWLKPLLHASYGLLAARPEIFETGFYRARGGVPTDYPMGRASIPAFATRSRHPVESRLANVLHRGMIEAEVRKEVLWFARYLREVDRHDVLAIYADSVFIRDTGKPVKLLPPPWRVQETCTDLTFYDPTHFRSRELTRLPGIAKNLSAEARESRLLEREILVNSARQQFKRSARRINAATEEAHDGGHSALAG